MAVPLCEVVADPRVRLLTHLEGVAAAVVSKRGEVRSGNLGDSALSSLDQADFGYLLRWRIDGCGGAISRHSARLGL